MKFLLPLFAIVLLIACTNTQPEEQNNEEQTAEATEAALFGADFDENSIAEMGAKFAELESADTVFATVKGEVLNVCQKKGCWMNVKTGYASQEEVFVRFEDYGFFMPKDLSGQEVAMAGYFFKETTSVEDLRHYAEDEGKSKEEIEQITEPEESVNFIATGVKILDNTES